jgi:hypothetical protein
MIQGQLGELFVQSEIKALATVSLFLGVEVPWAKVGYRYLLINIPETGGDYLACPGVGPQ